MISTDKTLSIRYFIYLMKLNNIKYDMQHRHARIDRFIDYLVAESMFTHATAGCLHKTYSASLQDISPPQYLPRQLPF